MDFSLVFCFALSNEFTLLFSLQLSHTFRCFVMAVFVMVEC